MEHNGVSSLAHHRPANCPHCGSSRVVPIVNGILDERLATLSAQGKIALGGCFDIDDGSAAWACADCLESVVEGCYCMQEGNPDFLAEYRTAIEQAFRDYDPIGKDAYERLETERFVLSLVRQRMSKGSDEIRFQLRGDKFGVGTFCQGELLGAITNEFCTAEEFRNIRELISFEEATETGPVWRVRLGRKDCFVRANVHSSEEIRIRRLPFAPGTASVTS